MSQLNIQRGREKTKCYPYKILISFAQVINLSQHININTIESLEYLFLRYDNEYSKPLIKAEKGIVRYNLIISLQSNIYFSLYA